MKIDTNPDKIQEILERGVDKVYPDKKTLRDLLLSGKRIRLYQGFDPSGPDLHIGHATGMKQLAKFQELGHEVIFLIGDFTGMIGDPTGKKEARQNLTREQVKENLKNYKKQATGILDFDHPENPVTIKYNYDWLSKLNFEDVLRLMSNVTLQQMAERDMFQERIKDKKPVFLHEFMYPLMQGYDSVDMEVDLEVGGSDQTFNMLMGRTLMKSLKNKEKLVLTRKLLTDPNGKKMGKSEGNMVRLKDKAQEIYGKIMSFTDGQIIPGFELLTEVPMDTIKTFAQEMKDGDNPMKYKKQLAFEVVKWLKDEKQAIEAQDYFEQAFQDRATPDKIEEVKIETGSWKLPELLADELKFASSRSEARRLIEQGAVSINDEKVLDPHKKVDIMSGDVVKSGKTHLVRIA